MDSGADSILEAATDSGRDTNQPPKDSGLITCNTPNDCPDPMEMVCDPTSLTCALDECGASSGKTCPRGGICVYQSATAGACYKRCTPFTQNACGPNQECVIGTYDGTVGYCKKNGGLPNGAMCLPSSIETGCVPGDVCVLDPTVRRCREQCDFWTGLHDCSSLACTPPGVCTGRTPDPSTLGAACNSPAGTLCGKSGNKLLGVCLGQPANCFAWCRTKFNDCPQNETCIPSNIPGIGSCQ